MKTFYVLLFCLLAWPSFAQDYHPLIQRGVYRDEFWAPQLNLCPYDFGSRYWFRGDTSVGGQVYQILLRAGIQGSPDAPAFCPPYTVDTTSGTLYALMREEVAERQVFQYDPANNTEFLLFDFSLQVGDSVTVGYPPQTGYVENEEYETWADGSSRRKLILHLPSAGYVPWIESLGAANNLWNPLSPTCICPHGICYQQNGQSLYGFDCAMVVRTEEPTNGAAGLLLTPNPASETVTVRIKAQDQTFDRLAVFRLSGQIVVEQDYTTDIFSDEISVSDWPSGNYVVVVWQAGKWIGRQVFQRN